jgi:hypothetical protein
MATTAKRTRQRRRGRMLRCLKGYSWKKVDRKKVALMRNNNTTATFTCGCDLIGGCKVTIDPHDPQTISCVESGCTGDCSWTISIRGIRSGTFALLRT